MSRELALRTIQLLPTDQLAHTEYSLGYHHNYIREVTGLEPGHEAMVSLYDHWGVDFLFGVNDGLHGNWLQRGRATDMGHAIYAADGSDQRETAVCPFTTVDDVYAFDPIEEYGLPDRAEQVAAYQKQLDDNRSAFPRQLGTGGYYKTIISGAIQAFGWDMLLLAAADPVKMEEVIDRIFRFTQFHMNAWVDTDAEVIIQHDDFVWTSGPFVRPDYYRQVIIPRYAELWKPLKAAGKKILFCSDGLFTMFMDDLAKAGAEGFIFEPCNDFAWVVERFGQSHCLVGSGVDCRDMTFHSWETVQAAMDSTFELARKCKGLIWAVGNHLPANIPQEIMERYIAYFQANRGK